MNRFSSSFFFRNRRVVVCIRRFAPATALAAAALFTLVSCDAESGFAIRIDAIRSTVEPAKPVALSLWLYPEGGEKVMSKIFTSEKIINRDWIPLDGDFISIASDLLSAESFFAFRIELNPNRFATPPDAVFRASVPLADLFYDEVGSSEPLAIRAQENPYEIKIVVRDNRSENRNDRE